MIQGNDNLLKIKNSKSKDTNQKVNSNIVKSLILLGFDPESINYSYQKYKFDSIEFALKILNKDDETQKYLHQFVESGGDCCKICKDIKANHLDNDNEIENINSIPNVSVSNFHDTQYNKPLLENKNISQQMPNKKCEIKKLEKSFLDELEERLFKNKELCLICFSNELCSELSYSMQQCKHVICKDCVSYYISSMIKEGKVNKN